MTTYEPDVAAKVHDRFDAVIRKYNLKETIEFTSDPTAVLYKKDGRKFSIKVTEVKK